MGERVLRKILIPTDFSRLSYAALDYAEILLEYQQPQIYLLHVLDKSQRKRKKKSKKESLKALQEAEKGAMKNLSAIAGQHLVEWNGVTLVVRNGEPYREIVKFAQDEKIDLIIISTHGRAGLAHVLMGSVAEKVVRYSPVPVLSVKPVRVQMELMEQEDIDEQLHLKPAVPKKRDN